MKTDSQKSAILAYLQSGRTLSPIEALNMFGCFRLGARVYDLKQEGHNIQMKLSRGDKKYAEYRIVYDGEQTRLAI